MADKNTTGTALLSRRTVLKAGAVAAAGIAAAGLGTMHFDKGQTAKPAPEPPTSGMTMNELPALGQKVSALGYGCMRFPVTRMESAFRNTNIDEQQSFRLVDFALDHGVNLFDTGYFYHGGASELVMGKALARHPRDKFLVSDKMPGYAVKSFEQAKGIFEDQLKKCQVDHFDIYLLHSLQQLQGYKQVYEDMGVLDYLLEQKRLGRIRALGFSFHGTVDMLEYALSRPVKWDCCLLQLNYFDMLRGLDVDNGFLKKMRGKLEPAPTAWMYGKVREAGIPMMVMEPLLGGKLARLNRKALAVLQTELPDASAASWAFRYAATLPGVFTALSGMTYMEPLRENLGTFAPIHPLSERELGVLKKALDVYVRSGSIRCTACSYCMPCPYGVDIPGVFTHYNRCLDDDTVPRNTQDPDYAKARRAYLADYDRSIPELRQANRCTGCGLCKSKCPQYINIPDEMKRLGSLVEKLRSEVLV